MFKIDSEVRRGISCPLGCSMYNGWSGDVDSSACVRVKGIESERFRIDSGVRQRYIMSPWMFNVYMNGGMKEVKMGMGRRGSELPGGWERVEIA